MALGREQTGIELPVGAQTRAAAIAAEGPGDRIDEPHRAVAVGPVPSLAGLAGVGLGPGAQFSQFLQTAQELVARNHAAAAPAVERAHVHELDEPQREAGAPEVPGQLFGLILVLATYGDGVDLDAAEDGMRPLDGVEN